MSIALRQSARPAPAVPGRNGLDMRQTRVSTTTPEHNGRRAAKMRSGRPFGGAAPDSEGAPADPRQTTTLSERRAIVRANRKAYKRMSR